MIMENMTLGFGSYVGKYQSILSIIAENNYGNSIGNLLKQVPNQKICYVTLSKPSSKLAKDFKAMGVNLENIFFIDGVSQGKLPENINAVMISSPFALTELSLALNTAVSSAAFDVIIFDSLSSLGMYHSERVEAATRFAAHLINTMGHSKSTLVFTCLEGDMKSKIIKGISPMIDKVMMVNDLTIIQPKHASYGMPFAIAVMLLGAISVGFFRQDTGLTGYAVDESAFHIAKTITLPTALYFTFLFSALAVAILYLSTHWKR